MKRIEDMPDPYTKEDRRKFRMWLLGGRGELTQDEKRELK